MVTNTQLGGVWSDALLFIDEPGAMGSPVTTQLVCGSSGAPSDSNGVCAVTGAVTGANPFSGETGRPNVFQGMIVSSNAVTFPGIPIDPPGPGFTRVFRITNLRVDASGVPPSEFTPGMITASISSSGSTSLPISSPSVVTGFTQYGINVSVVNVPELMQSASNNSAIALDPAQAATPDFTLRFTENYATAFKLRNTATTTSTPNALAAQNWPGAIYNTETGFYNPDFPVIAGHGDLATAGLANQGTRLMAHFNNVPAGVKIFVPTSVSSGAVRLVSAGAHGEPPYAPVSGNGTGWVQVGSDGITVWEILSASSIMAERVDIPVAVAYVAGAGTPALGTATVNGSFAPVDPQDGSVSNVPRFGDTSTPLTAFSIVSYLRAAMTSPTAGSTLPGSSATFSWNAGTGADAYWLDVGTAQASGDLWAGQLITTSQTVTGLPCDGRTLYARLWTRVSGAWKTPYDYTYKACVSPAAISSPAPGSTLAGTSITFSWTASTGATDYWLDVGNSVGSGDISAGLATSTSRTVNNLPCDGRTIHVRLWTRGGGVWLAPIDYTYTGCNISRAQMSSPSAGSTLAGTSVTFSWTAGTSADLYWLDVGNSVGSGDLSAGSTPTTSRTASNLPCDGRTIYVRLWTHANSLWQEPVDYTYKACTDARARLSSPTPGSTLAGISATFSWTTATGADLYWLDVGNSVGMGDISAGSTSSTVRVVGNLPSDGRTLYVRLWSHIGGVWQMPLDYTYKAYTDARARLSSPTPGSTLAGTSVTFSWSAGTGAGLYWLDVGNNLGIGDIAAGPTASTSTVVNSLPCDGRTIYTRLWTQIGGVWQAPLDYTYKACGI